MGTVLGRGCGQDLRLCETQGVGGEEEGGREGGGRVGGREGGREERREGGRKGGREGGGSRGKKRGYYLCSFHLFLHVPTDKMGGCSFIPRLSIQRGTSRPTGLSTTRR